MFLRIGFSRSISLSRVELEANRSTAQLDKPVQFKMASTDSPRPLTITFALTHELYSQVLSGQKTGASRRPVRGVKAIGART